MFRYFKIAAFFILVIFLQTGLFAQEVAEENKTAPPEEAEAGSKIIETKPGNVTMDFKDADINNVLRILSYKSGLNIVASKDVTGLVTIRLTDVPWEKALDVILRTYGYTYEKDGNIIRVITAESVQKEELITETFLLSYAKAKDMPEALKEMISERGKIKYDERTNTLVITDIPSNLYKIRQVIATLDRRTPQVNIEAKIIETSLDKDDNLGINWTMKLAASGPKRPTTFPFTAGGIKGRGNKVFPEVMTPEDLREYTKTAYDDEGNPISTETEQKMWYTLREGFPAVDVKNFVFGTLDFSQFQAVLEVLASKADTKLISNPRITTVNNQEAKIVVGTKIPIAQYTQDPSTGLWRITGREKESQEIGIKLTVTPHINPEGYITVDIHPEVSSIVNWTGPDNAWAVTSTREAITQVMVKDGQTIVIGGLIKENIIDKRNKVPLLGDIPVVGWLLFRKTEKAIEKTDLLFFITVNLVDIDKQNTVTEK